MAGAQSGERRKQVLAKNVNDIIKKLNAAQRKKVEARAAQLVAEEMTRRKLRKARTLTR